MRKNRVRELRKARGLTAVELARMLDIDHSYLVRIETGERAKRGIALALAEKLAVALEVSVSEVLGVDNGAGTGAASAIGELHEDVVPYEFGPGDPVVASRKGDRNVSPYEVKSNALTAIGIKPGARLFIDHSADAVEGVKALAVVIAQIYDFNSMKARTVLRQFVPPSLLITNSEQGNEHMIDMSKDDAAIKGVMIGSYNQA